MLELLALQASLDRRGRIADCDGVTIASCEHGQLLWIGDGVVDATADALRAAFEQSPRLGRELPPAVAACAQLLAMVDTPWAFGPSDVILPG